MKKILAVLFLILAGMYQLACNKAATPTQAGNAVSTFVTSIQVTPVFSDPSSPRSLAFDKQGNLLVGHGSWGYIYSVNPQGTPTQFSQHNYKELALAVDPATNAVFSFSGDSGRILKTVNGTTTTFMSGMHHTAGMAIYNGTIYFTHPGNHTAPNTLFSVPTSGGTVKTVATGFNYPHGVAVDKSGVLYVADSSNGAIVKVVNGAKTNFYTGLNFPWGVAVDTKGNVYVTEEGNGKVDMISTTGHLTTLTTSSNPYGIAVDNGGRVYYSDANTYNVYQITLPIYP